MLFISTSKTEHPTKKGFFEISFVHNFPFHEHYGMGKTVEELESEGILIDSLPEAENKEGFYNLRYINPVTKEIYFEYKVIPPSKEELLNYKIADLEIELLKLNKK